MNKQIEEMAKELCSDCNRSCAVCNDRNYCISYRASSALYNAGYRKASDVARELISEIADLIWQGESEKMNFSIGGRYYDKQEFIAELKKKYESEGAE